jgi:hypothetical protein
MASYRKIWKSYYGEIPVDENNVRYEIHHIDGNRTNNDIANLVCISIEEHYKIHLEQGDWGAVRSILSRMNLSEDEVKLKSLAASNQQKELLKRGEHNWQKFDRSELSKQTMQKRLKETGVAFLGIINPVENSRKGGLAAAAKQAGFLNTKSKNHGSQHVKETLWWNNGVKNKRSKECPGEGYVLGILPGGKHWWYNEDTQQRIKSKDCPGKSWKKGMK